MFRRRVDSRSLRRRMVRDRTGRARTLRVARAVERRKRRPLRQSGVARLPILDAVLKTDGPLDSPRSVAGRRTTVALRTTLGLPRTTAQLRVGHRLNVDARPSADERSNQRLRPNA